MALQHEFVFVSNEKGELSSEDFSWNNREFCYKDGTAVEECVILNDEIVLYVSDFLHWIPTYNPSRREKGFGIHYYGITKIEKEGAKIAVDLFRSLISLFSLAPEKIELTGSFQWTSDCNTDGEYEKIFLKRDILCAELESLVKLCYKVKEGEGYLLHFGV
ncbi:coproporphyrinogen III oxidase [Bacillus sp. DX4.1]|uniref:coproporphyrinogen III oxidase n=1 Tax=Bacillus sp. DX4.1 TaxID=3055867 RepID=UPI00259FEF93|nr:coproporphyrinogen III oxidase [Bacillus sp. DX4.1]MDM5189330.1 coproporphyrinogen III oxidase [Bacillus sp. DX4.1]